MSETMNYTQITEDRGQIQDGRSKIASNRAKVIVVIAGLTIASYLLWTILATGNTENNIKIPTTDTIRQTEQFREVVYSPAAMELAPSPPELTQVVLPVPDPEYIFEEEPDPLMIAAQRAPVLAFSASTSPRITSNMTSDTTSEQSTNDMLFVQARAQSGDQQRFSSLMKPTVMEGTRAGVIGDRNLVIAMGTSIPCILETALSSDQPGFTSCIISRDILSDNGRVVLLDKGSQIIGEYRGGLQQGQKRIFVLWTRAKTPNGVIIELNSPATDALGRAGFDGHVNTHWWQRFGSAILLSVIGDGTKILADQLSNNPHIRIEQPAQEVKQMASHVLENQINIPPTLEKHHGEMVNIFVARDLDFSGVYRLKITKNKNEGF